MTLLSSLTNRIFFGSALLTVLAIGIAVYNVNVAVTTQAEQELRRGLDEAWRLIEENRGVLVEHFSREARLVADIPPLKAAVDTKHPQTVEPIALEYQRQLDADLFLVTHRTAGVLARLASPAAAGGAYDALPGVQAALAGRGSSSFWPHPGGMLQVVSVPIWGAPPPEILGTLSVGFSLDEPAVTRFRELTNSEIAFGMNDAIQISSLPQELWSELTPLLAVDGLSPVVSLGDSEFIALTMPLRAPELGAVRVTPAASRPQDDAPRAIILRSRTERLRFLNTLHTSLLVTAIVAVLAATILSYAIARTVTRPLGTITATMREMAATGDLTRKIPVSSSKRWEDEDATLLATTFNTMTESIARFQREAAQRERLSSLGRLSTVVAHEIRNPLMIIKAALRGLRQDEVPPATLRAAAADIDEEITRLNRIVTEVLDFARPIKFDLSRVDLNALCRDAAHASGADGRALDVSLRLDDSLPPLVTDAERLRLTLVNILGNARLAVSARQERPPSGAITLATARLGTSRVLITVRDRGAGIAPEDLPRVFDPYFTTRQTGTGLGLAISKNIIEGLGGTIAVTSRRGEGTEVRIELPLEAPQSAGPPPTR
jgi:signal transduction histidine kinase